MMSAQGVMVMISMTAVARVREHYVLVLVVADPIPAAFGLGQVSGSFGKDRTDFSLQGSWVSFLLWPFVSSYEEWLYHGAVISIRQPGL